MKQNILNFNQQELINSKKIVDGKEIKLDCNDIVILDWFIFFTPKMQSVNFNGKIYYWLAYSKMQNDLPFLELSKRGFADRLKKLCELDILSFYLNKEQGNTTYYGFGDRYINLIENNTLCSQNDILCGSNNKGYVAQATKGMQLEQQTYNSINNNTINNNTINIKENIKEIFDYWNSCDIIKHIKITEDIARILKTRLNEYDVEQLKECISHYSEAYHSDYEYCNFKWSILTFFKQKNAYLDFMEDGSKWNNYCRWKNENNVSYTLTLDTKNEQQRELQYYTNLKNTNKKKYDEELEQLKYWKPELYDYIYNQLENGGFEEL